MNQTDLDDLRTSLDPRDFDPQEEERLKEKDEKWWKRNIDKRIIKKGSSND